MLRIKYQSLIHSKVYTYQEKGYKDMKLCEMFIIFKSKDLLEILSSNSPLIRAIAAEIKKKRKS